MKNKRLKEKILNIGDYIAEIINKKTEEFDKCVKRLKLMKVMNLTIH